MSKHFVRWMTVAAVLVVVDASGGAEAGGPIWGVANQAALDEEAGQPVDLALWAYAWRADLAVQEKPETCFVPRRLERIDKVYRTAAIEIPARTPPKSVLLRLRHPKAAPIRSVTVNGKAWTGFNKDKELIELVGIAGKVIVVAGY